MSNPSSNVLSDKLGATARELEDSNTLRLPCRASCVVDLTSTAQLPDISALARSAGGLVVLGGGSNVVLPAVISLPVVRVQLRGIQPFQAGSDAWIIDVAAGENWHRWVDFSLSRGWDGLENLALIPGTVGAAPIQNIGAYGVEVASRIESVMAWNVAEGRMETFSRRECQFGYRDSIFKRAPAGSWIIVCVRFALPRFWMPVLGYPDLARRPELSAADVSARKVFKAVVEVRRAKLPDPADLPNAGSFFKNPVVPAERVEALHAQFPGLVSYAQPDGMHKLAAGWLIEQCGFKGRREGAVGMHQNQALVMVNHGGASAADLRNFALQVASTVRDRFGVELEPEPVFIPGKLAA
ncbi:MAG: UDP-N-acetylmuramate dehydrogenase [Burkholderiaceae bacterium]|jgi:UDP-N-acetylmuramate dehydrogenase|nr:UDP-N-acetylmuramate dehydrogenase [Burkholderiaceae bacterium]